MPDEQVRSVLIVEQDVRSRVRDLLDRTAVPWERVAFAAVTGSQAYGLSTGGGDTDVTIVWTEGYRDLVTRSAGKGALMLRTKPDGQRSGPGDIDMQVYTVRHFVHLAAGGNPSILAALFSPTSMLLADGGFPRDEVIALTRSRRAGAAFLGYLDSQLGRWREGRISGRVHRPELIEQHGYDCYLDDTEFLTRRGWLKYDDVLDDEAVATVNQSTGKVEFQKPIERIAKPYSGPIHYGNNYGTNWAVTPNHRMWVSKVERGPSGILGSSYRSDAATWGFRRADEVTTRQWHMRVAGEPSDQEFPVSDTYLALLGAYLSEGSIGKRRKNGDASVLRFEQKDGGRLHAIMNFIAADYPLRIYKYPEKRPVTTWTLADRNVVAQLVKECRSSGSKNLRLPEWVFDLSARQADLLLDAMLAGDGTRHRSGGWVLYTSSQGLAGDAQALAAISGRRATAWGPYQGPPYFGDIYQVRIHDRGDPVIMPFNSRRTMKVEQVSDARVVCFTVPNETLVTRRSGKIAMHGNTKYASHAIRLGIQGIEYLTTGTITLPIPDPGRGRLLAVRAGGIPEAEALDWCEQVRDDLLNAVEGSSLPVKPDQGMLDDWLVGWHRSRD